MDRFRKLLQKRQAALKVAPEEIRESFRRSGGPGGQNVNKVETGVTVKHLPSGLTASSEDSRSREQNRLSALSRLLDRIESERRAILLAKRAETAKKRRQSAKRSPSAKRKILAQKRRRSEIKKLRSSSTPE